MKLKTGIPSVADFAENIHEYLDQLQTKMNRVGIGIGETFFATRVATPIRKKAKERTMVPPSVA